MNIDNRLRKLDSASRAFDNVRLGRMTFIALLATIAMIFAISSPRAFAQIPTVVFQDDFSSNKIDPALYQADAPFFEGGLGDVHAQAGNGVMEFVGTTSQQWWSGGTLQIVQSFNATEQTPVTLSIDRVAEAGVGTASRSALWILDETKTKYVLFADVRGEGGWHYNRKIGENGDVPTGSGTDIAAFNGGNFDDGGLHHMKMVANGSTVKLYLDDILGVEVKFPFAKVIFEFGSYARANNDTADTSWDNLKVETALPTTVVFSDDFSSSTINAAKFKPDAPFFEGGTGDVHAQAGNGVIEFVGTTSVQWWSGGTLQVVPTFNATEQTPVAITIDRISEKGVGTASRSALWILDETLTKYVLFADVRGEGGWHYNRKIGENGDVPTGSGTDIAAFNGANYDDGGLHKMKIIADGKTVKLLLDDVQGVEVKFPFSKIVFEFGSYARANNDTADTTWDNIKVETVVRRSNVVFSDDFASNTIDPKKYAPDAPFFEGGIGDIHAQAGNGVIEFVGTTSQQWWSGGTLRIVPTFTASDAETLTLSVDRVAEKGVGTASRSALWILDESLTKYVLFADVRGEGGWRFNRKIGEDGDVPTGSGTDIAAFNGATFDDGGLHRMSMIADGKTVKLLLDGQQGAEVKFPFSPVVFEIGSYARANNDTADTIWDNLKIESAGGATFVPGTVSVRNGQASPNVTVRIPQGLNSQTPVQLRVVSSDPKIAVPDGGTAGALALTFPAGGPNTAIFKVRGVSLGGAQFTIEGDIAGGNKLSVAVISDPGVVLQENFAAASIDTSKWQISKRSFEVGTGTYDVAVKSGSLEISGVGVDNYWGGASLKTAKSYVATKELNLVFEVDRVSIDQVGSAGRTGVFITTDDRSKWVFFAQDVGETGWEVNVNPGNPTGSGTALPAFASIADLGLHRMRLVADGQTVEVFLDGKSGGKFPFEVTTGIFFEVGAYARATDDTVRGVFDNVKIEGALPCLNVSPESVSITAAETGKQITLTIPQLLNDAAPVSVTITSRDPKVAAPNGAGNGSLILNFATGSPNTQTITVTPMGTLGSTTFDITSNPQNCVSTPLKVEVVAFPQVLLSDDFSGKVVDANKWLLDSTAFNTDNPGTATADSAITLTNGQAKVSVTVDTASWPGLALFTKQTFLASATEPVTFEIDRTLLDFVLVTGTGANQRAGIWVKDANGNSLFFSDNEAHDGRNYGWRYNRLIGQPDDNPTDAGINIAAFDGGNFDDAKKHRMKMVVNGSTAKLYLDDVFGVEVSFPFSKGLTFGFGAYVAAVPDIVYGYFDNAKITGGSAPIPTQARLAAAVQGGNVVISWTGTGTLQEADALTTPASWKDVSPTPTGTTYPVPAGAKTKFYRLRL